MFRRATVTTIFSYLTVGGAPAGLSMCPDDSGCRTTSNNITINSIHGKSRTKPSGIEMRELPFNLMRLLKMLNLGDILSAVFERSSIFGSAAVEGRRFFRPCKRSMVLMADQGGLSRTCRSGRAKVFEL